MFGKKIEGSGQGVGVLGKRFNPRVRGTCLVSIRAPLLCSKNLLLGFQSPCAGNMFGKIEESSLEIIYHQLGQSFNPRVRGTCLVRRPRARHLQPPARR